MDGDRIGLLLCDDLLFASRISGTARTLGRSLTVARSSAELAAQADALAPSGPACVILDLQLAGADIDTIVKRFKQQACVVGYGSHVDAATLRLAREAGCDVVLPRSKFVEELADALPRWFAGVP